MFLIPDQSGAAAGKPSNLLERSGLYDSPLEGDGFELSVPRQKDNVFEAPQLDSAIPGEAIAHQMSTA